MLALGLTAFGIVLGTLVIVSGVVFFALWSVILGATAGFVAGLPTTIIADRVDSSLHGIAIAWLRTATDAGMLIGPAGDGAARGRRGSHDPLSPGSNHFVRVRLALPSAGVEDVEFKPTS